MASTGTVVTTVQVLSVVTDGTQQVIWTFDHTIDLVNDPSGLLVAGDVPGIIVSQVGAVLTMIYSVNHFASEAWAVDPPTLDITFIPPDSILAQSGLTT